MKKNSAPPFPPGPREREARHRILLVDDHPMMRAGLVQLIDAQDDMAVCAEAGAAGDAVAAAIKHRPDLIVTDLTLPGRGGLELIADLHSAEPRSAILVLSMHDEAFYAERALRAGARGYIMKDAGAKLLLEAMRRVLEGSIYLSPTASEKALSHLAGADFLRSRSSLDRLTSREFEVYRLIGEGRESEDIAQQLHLSRKTVDVHRGNIKKKLGLASGTSLVHHAVRWREHEHAHKSQPLP